MTDNYRECPHCKKRLSKWRVPDESSWAEEFFYVCFNDDCTYYKNGWSWMKERYNQNSSYRYALNPTTNGSSPLPVWSDSATREMIVDDTKGDDV